MKTVIKKARKGQYERKYRTTGKTGPASECVTKKLDKPTAQELWERITVKILKTSVAWTEAMGDSTGKSLDKFDKHEAELHVLVRSYAQTYHEEQIMKPSPSSPHTKRT